ncbi:putative 2-aminoethylphosphonate import ATP-binding protein PhnT [Pseudovibrio axinellae]|uniref:Putative 2-aminoethylphosphonate import ATP-binding protein PhnT n=1 Tax=Pseudovibrio axinellae TaxID=989403 RepID=A0A165YIL5_9HYPH|nr:ABC transporter ATP-binding protein [Pseudovibrio axinellae]KZL18874.1 putative 2-aminoethylphosphonate import ATP-binding protein PhnT [Pseudovibrio axinellae]SEP89499.1 spermidine/putrescine transport system ATP-binding protein [Pseudovibrio axinellae]
MRGNDVILENLSMRFGDFVAVQPTDLKINAGEFFSILGPSGCGKTTILRMISGFLSPSQGRVIIGDKDMSGIRANARPTALIFQNLALFPLMSVRDNIAFGLEARGIGKKARQDKAQELLSLVALDGHGDKLPTALSGGQRQRVAIARALAVEPSVLLLDEPLSALDLKLRQHMRAELKELQRKTGVTFIYITHDQGEALTMSDRVAVMNKGVVEQVANSDEIYANPATPFVASFVGEQNVFKGKVVAKENGYAILETPLGKMLGQNTQGLNQGDDAILFVRPERLSLQEKPGQQNSLSATLERRDLEGPFVNLHMRAGEHPIAIHITNVDQTHQSLGTEQKLWFAAQDAVVMRPGELASE